jgi:hypothetical protein
MVIKVLIGLAVIVVVLVAVVATRPSEFRVERTATITAPAPVVFAKMNGDRTAVTWSLDGRNKVGGDFETGLAQMKSVVEAAPRQ